jgi:hypothetical protein
MEFPCSVSLQRFIEGSGTAKHEFLLLPTGRRSATEGLVRTIYEEMRIPNATVAWKDGYRLTTSLVMEHRPHVDMHGRGQSSSYGRSRCCDCNIC